MTFPEELEKRLQEPPPTPSLKNRKMTEDKPVSKPPKILSVDEAEKFLFQNSMLSMHGAHETINKFIKRFPNGIRIEE